MNDEILYRAFFEEQRLGLFEYLGQGVFRPVGPPPRFLSAILGGVAANSPTLRLGNSMPFVENFIVDAEEFWNSHAEGRAESGAWIEEDEGGREQALEASAVWLAGRKVLLIQNAQQRYDERVQVLQTGHDSLLEHERLLREFQEKEILLHYIVHDLSQPLTAIRGSLSILKLQAMTPEFKEALEIAERQAEKQEGMIRGILQVFSAALRAQRAIESDPQKAPDLVRCAELTVKVFRTAFQERGAQIALAPDLNPGDVWRVKGEESRLLRIFGNLVENALRHSPAGSTVTLGAIIDQNFVIGFVDDEGPGLPKDGTTNLFFTLLVKSKGAGAGKAGMGLHFCKITVERWGGTIGCENRPAVGVRFWFRLPRATGNSGNLGAS